MNTKKIGHPTGVDGWPSTSLPTVTGMWVPKVKALELEHEMERVTDENTNLRLLLSKVKLATLDRGFYSKSLENLCQSIDKVLKGNEKMNQLYEDDSEKQFQEELDHIGEYLGKSCPQCEKIVDEISLKLAAKPTWDDVNAEIRRCNQVLSENQELKRENEELKQQVKQMSIVYNRSGCLLADLEKLQKENAHLQQQLNELKADYDGLMEHHEITDEIIKDAQGMSPKDGKALLYNYNKLKQQLQQLLTQK